MKILVIGESCLDIFVYGSATRLCPESPAPVFSPQEEKTSGGMAKNVFNILKRYNANCELLTNDSKIIKRRYIDKKSNYLFLRVDENDSCNRIKNISDINFKKYDAVIISDYNKGYLSCEDIHLISSFHSNCFLDTKKELGSWCENIRFIKINRKEYENNKKNLDENLFNKLIITLDNEGCMFNNKIYPTKKVKTPDRTGAGDCFIASLAYKYIDCKNIHKSIKYANKIAYDYVLNGL